ncbi:PQQ-dependent catabolism-associated CXXCW motif protein [uncultured Thiothrix sp.]|uniref:PQQ-dependent catabolism-associated CXXCW motif protein n=1 Tax=uncultured Thiothrix sp. TaxID=223185 RepID=UPI0026343B3A|nr:PQQ-dependent catabolism-associated CXXCW motif protein [uncultured Thiothrix sp.]HMT91530.1 PQQ-dependent catabolism-associated CXXCW motif protein [Thiolinea sp.]
MRVWLLLILSWSIFSCQAEDCVRTPQMPEGLKQEHYRSPTPACVPNGITLKTAELQKLIETKQPILIDVMAVFLREDEGFPATWLVNEPHESLPNSIWLPNVGYGVLEPKIEAWFKAQLASLTKNDLHQALVFYCVADCWMSWNAVQRVREYGYTRVYWYKDGIDGWKEAGLPTVKTEPQTFTSN